MALSKELKQRAEAFIQSEKFKTLALEKQNQLLSVIEKQPVTSEFLPGQERTERLISQRRPAIEEFKESAAEFRRPETGVIGKAIRAPFLGLQGLGVLATPLRRLEAGIAAPLSRIQEPETLEKAGVTTGAVLPREEGFDKFKEETMKQAELSRQKAPQRKQFLGELGRESLAGLKGERRIEFGDIPRRAGFPEPLSAFIGLGTAVAIIDPVVNKAVTKTITKIGRSIKDAFSTDRTKILRGVEDFVGGIDDVVDEAGKNVGQIFRGDIGKKSVDANRLATIIKALPKRIVDKIKTEGVKLFKIKLDKAGNPIPDKFNLWKVRRFVDDFISPKTFKEGATKAEKLRLVKVRRLMKQMLKKGDDVIDDVMEQYGKIVDDLDFVKSSLTEKGRPVANKFIRLFKGKGGEPAKTEAVQRLAKFVPRAQKVINDAIKFNRATAIRRRTLGTLGTAAGFLAARKFLIKPITQATGGGSQTVKE